MIKDSPKLGFSVLVRLLNNYDRQSVSTMEVYLINYNYMRTLNVWIYIKCRQVNVWLSIFMLTLFDDKTIQKVHVIGPSWHYIFLYVTASPKNDGFLS